MNSTELAALAAVFLLTGLSCFQFMLALGRPWGRLAWGGANQILSPKMRLASGLSIFIYLAFGWVILERAGLANILGSPEWLGSIIWALVAYLFIGVLMKAASRSLPERLVMTPLALSLALLTLFVAIKS